MSDAEDFTQVGTWTLVCLGVMAALSYAVDFAAAALFWSDGLRLWADHDAKPRVSRSVCDNLTC